MSDGGGDDRAERVDKKAVICSACGLQFKDRNDFANHAYRKHYEMRDELMKQAKKPNVPNPYAITCPK
jgi:hypothetical protein